VNVLMAVEMGAACALANIVVARANAPIAAPEMSCFDIFVSRLDLLGELSPNELSALSSRFQVCALKWA